MNGDGPSFNATTESGNITQAMEVDQSQGKTVVEGNVDKIEQTHNYGDSAWQPVEDYIANEIPSESQEAVTAAVQQIKESQDRSDVIPESEWSSVIDVLKPYKPLGDLIVKAAPGLTTMIMEAMA